MKLTMVETMIVRAVRSRPDEWLNCFGAYIGEVLTLQFKGVVESRVVDSQLQVKSR